MGSPRLRRWERFRHWINLRDRAASDCRRRTRSWRWSIWKLAKGYCRLERKAKSASVDHKS